MNKKRIDKDIDTLESKANLDTNLITFHLQKDSTRRSKPLGPMEPTTRSRKNTSNSTFMDSKKNV